MNCRFFNDCRDFLGHYLKIGRRDLHQKYVEQFCGSHDKASCKRKQSFLSQKQPDPLMTPLGQSSFLHKLYR